MALVLALVLLPAGYVVGQLFAPAGAHWPHLASTLLLDYAWHSALLLAGVAVVVLVLAVPSAWLVSAYRFPGQRAFDSLLMVPLAMPTYIAATVYADMCSYTGSLQAAYQWLFPGESLPFDILSMPGAMLVMGSVLYPYTFIMARASFRGQSRTLLEASRLLGQGLWPSFFRIALPLARPAIAGSLFLVAMEVLNEYGTVKYYGISTFTTGIFKAWLSMGDLGSAVRLSALLLLSVLLLLWLERWQRGAQRFAASPKSMRPSERQALRGAAKWAAFLYCCLPLALGFGLPVGQMGYWAWERGTAALTHDFWMWLRNTLAVGTAAAGLTLAAALWLVYAARLSGSGRMQYLARLGTLGYAVPGAVIAVGIMAAFRHADTLLSWWQGKPGLWLSGSLAALLAAYLIRFLAIAYNPLEAGFEKTAGQLDEASRALGRSPWHTLRRIHLPLLRSSLLSAALMVGIEVMKELPLTLILRPFNFDTLATKAFELASDEQIQAAAPASLLIVAVGILPVLSLINALDRS
jgi:iron(III) transport system permease protein